MLRFVRNDNTETKLLKKLLLLLAAPITALAISKSGQVSVVVDGYINLPDISNEQFAPISETSAATANTVTQSPYNIETSYDIVSPTPNVQLSASVDANHQDSTGVFMTDNAGATDVHKVYFTMSYLTCGSRTTKALVRYDQASLSPTQVITHNNATTQACLAQPGELSYTRLAITPEHYPPSGKDYAATITLTAQAVGS